MLSKLWHGLWRRKLIACPECDGHSDAEPARQRSSCAYCKGSGRVTAPLISTGMWITIGMALVLGYCMWEARG